MRHATWLRRCLRALAAAAIAVALAPADLRAEPALWSVRSRTATVYLFGTVHALKRDMTWHSPKLDAAFAASDELWLEIPNADDQDVGSALINRYGVDANHPLSTKLDAALLADVDRAARLSGMPNGEAGLELTRPWLAALIVAVAPLKMAGYDMGSGVDQQLKTAAVASGKRVRGFETYERQIRYFADLSPDNEIAFLRSATDDVAAGPTKLESMIDAWAAGDLTRLTTLLLEKDKHEAPDLYRVLFVERNIRFADAIAERLKAWSGVSFMAVGAGHLAGPDSIQVQLTARGIKVERE